MARAHIHAHISSGMAQIAAIATSSTERATELAAFCPEPPAIIDIDGLLANDTIHAIDVCGHTQRHADVARRALQAGKHVLIEKPPALDLPAFDQVVDAAAQRPDLVAMVGQTVRYQPAVSELIRAVDEGDIGDARLVHLSWYAGYVWPRAWRGWQLDPDKSGGHLIHNGMHSLDLAIRLIGGTPIRVFARGWNTYAPDLPTPDSFHVAIEFDNSALAIAETSYGLRPPANPLRRILVAGSEGSLLHDSLAETELRSPTHIEEPASVRDAMTHEIAAWLAAILNRKTSPIPLHFSRTVLATAIAAQESLDSGQPIELKARP